MMIKGQAKINGTDTTSADNFVLFKNDGEIICVEAQKDSVILVMNGDLSINRLRLTDFF